MENGITPTFDMNQNSGFGGNAWIWIILLFFLFGFGGNGFGNSNHTEDEFIKRDLFNMSQAQSSCCCETNRNIDSVRADAYKNTCEITTAIHAEAEQTRALINAQAMQDLRDRLEERDRQLMTANFQLSQQAQTANIIDTLQPTPKPAYLTCSPYFAYGYNGCGCQGCGNI